MSQRGLLTEYGPTCTVGLRDGVPIYGLVPSQRVHFNGEVK